MTQQQIDLLPESIRRQCESGARTGRLVAAVLAAVVLIVIFSTQARFQLERERQQYQKAYERAEAVHEAERQATQLTADLEKIRHFISTYERLSSPLDVSAVLATLINELPGSVTLESIDLNAGERRAARVIRGASGEDGPPPRLLVGELRGFALTEDDIIRYVMRLQNREGFEDVRLDSSRTRTVRETVAREFEVSFRLDLGRRYDIIEATVSAGSASEVVQ